RRPPPSSTLFPYTTLFRSSFTPFFTVPVLCRKSSEEPRNTGADVLSRRTAHRSSPQPGTVPHTLTCSMRGHGGGQDRCVQTYHDQHRVLGPDVVVEVGVDVWPPTAERYAIHITVEHPIGITDHQRPRVQAGALTEPLGSLT